MFARLQQRQVQQFMLCRRSRRFTDSVPTVQTVQKIEEISQVRLMDKVGISAKDRGDYTNAVPGQGCRHSCGGATPGVHDSGGDEHSVEEVKWTTTGRVSR